MIKDTLDVILRANDLVAVLGREVQVRLVEISGSGCLLESGSRCAEGTTGSLRVVFEGLEYVDDVRIIRCRECEGSATLYQLGAEFLWTTNPLDHSLRRVIGSLQANSVKTGRLEESGRI